MFHLRGMYEEIFGSQVEVKRTDEDAKLYKIGYILNLLPDIDESMDSLMQACGETEELEIF